ncbi:MAG: hypothetical protein FJZ96_13230 [Chloroflexi bacterium]|nr:hypothetical protein [Chloroflexota bacterium]
MPIPTLALSLVYWLHLLASIFAVGGLAALSLFVFPAARTLEPILRADFLGRIQRRLEAVGWFSLAVLVATGLFQISANPHYQGFMALDDPWAQSILLKHVAVFAMAAVAMTQTWGVIPAMRRALMLAQKTGNVRELVRLQRREVWLVGLNTGLALVTLLLTAIARAA